AARAREMVAAACQESSLIATTPSPGKGLFQLISQGFINRANKQGGVFSARGNTCGILPDYLYFWKRHPKAAAGACAACVELSGAGAGFYAAPLARLPRSFKPITVKP